MRWAGSALGLLALVLTALYGGNVLDVRDRLTGSAPPEARPPATGRSIAAATTAPAPARPPTRVRSHPWWQVVHTASGDAGAASVGVQIADHALQWRVRWTCDRGALEVRAPGQRTPIVSGRCEGQAEPGYATVTGDLPLQVLAEAAWELQVEQQLDVPLEEPPLPEMAAAGAQVVARGTFYDMDQTGRGEVSVHRLADGRHVLRLEQFFVTPNVDLEVRLSPLAQPRTTKEYRSADAALVEVLGPTTGSMNLPIPAAVDPAAFRSVVIWCPPLLSAYAGASLAAPR